MCGICSYQKWAIFEVVLLLFCARYNHILNVFIWFYFILYVLNNFWKMPEIARNNGGKCRKLKNGSNWLEPAQQYKWLPQNKKPDQMEQNRPILRPRVHLGYPCVHIFLWENFRKNPKRFWFWFCFWGRMYLFRLAWIPCASVVSWYISRMCMKSLLPQMWYSKL